MTQQLGNWADVDGTGEVFDSSTVFVIPNGARRSPDASWILLERWNRLSQRQQDGFPPIAPDFVIELVRGVPWNARTSSDLKNQRYEDLQNKMQEYISNGVKLGWLIEPSVKKVEIYRTQRSVEILNKPKTLSGEDVLSGLSLDLTNIFS